MKACSFAALVAVLLLASTARAEAPNITPTEALARVCLHEASAPMPVDEDDDGVVDLWVRVSPDDREWTDVWYGTHVDERGRTFVEWGFDCRLIHEVLLRVADRFDAAIPPARRYVLAAFAYSTRVFQPEATDTNRWASVARPGRRPPERWESLTRGLAAWSRVEPRIAHAFEVAGALLELRLEDVADWAICSEPVTDWGGRMDHEHARSIGLIEVDCGPTANTGWVRPARRGE